LTLWRCAAKAISPFFILVVLAV